ncbi:uncharacterized protein LOC132740544 [Ruditapes philippinarum]|uniref:uncharacterized protein LOC132740544 n=1 Tax=Ruditapes philippinarum TaxID=129788 RepID=UPI00295A816A|nr:uncharacterized protein LOC132740544 [Ruditapes philippinarum]
MEVLIYLIILFSCCVCDRLELPAYEYLRRFSEPLHLGQCAHRIVQYPEGPYPEDCSFPSRKGKEEFRYKKVHSQQLKPVHDVQQMMQYLRMCDVKSAQYFGLLAKGDCVATDIAEQLSFKRKTATWIYKEHLRPMIYSLKANPDLSIPDEFTLYLNNTYYTENISIGTDEVIIVQLLFRGIDQAKKAYSGQNITNVMSEKLLDIAQTVGSPRKLKVIRLSTSGEIFESTNFKSQFAIFEAIQHVKQVEKQISRIRHELQNGMRSPHLKYIFKDYEIGPIALPVSTVTKEERQRLWQEVALLQIEVKRTYSTNRRYRKFCLTKVSHQKYCVLMKQTLKELKRAITMIHTQRRDWSKINYDQQKQFLSKAKLKVKVLRTRTNMLAKIIKKLLKN